MNVELIKAVLQDEEACKFIKALLMSDEKNATGPDLMHVWCAECLNHVDGKVYYHPVVTATETPTLENMMKPTYYHMLADANQFVAMRHEGFCEMAASMSGKKVRLIAVPKAVYEELQTALVGLITKILAEAEKTFEPLENICRFTRTLAEPMKVTMLMNIFKEMDTLYECFDQQMVITDSEEHVYEAPEVEEDEEAEDEYCVYDQPYPCYDCPRYSYCEDRREDED